MNQLQKKETLPLTVLLFGIAAGLVRGVLYLTAADSRDLLVRNHPLAIALWLLCAAAGVLISLQVLPRKGSNQFADNFDGGLVPAAGCWLLALGIVLTLLWGNSSRRSLLAMLWLLCGILGAGGLVWAGIDRLRGKVPSVLPYTALTLFLALHMVSRYQPWSGNPQLQDWVFSLAASAALTLCAYHHSAFCAGLGHRRMLLLTSLVSVFACCAALPHTEHFFLYLFGGVWAYTNLCQVTPSQPEEQASVPQADPETE